MAPGPDRPGRPTALWRPAHTPALLLAAVVLTAAACGGEGEQPPPAPSARTMPRDAAGDRIGTLSVGTAQGPRACTASVVHSTRRDLLVTAAHCVDDGQGGPPEDLVFTPGYRKGLAPYGSWPVDAVTVDRRWTEDLDPEYDVAFVTVRPVGGRQIEDVVGANALGGTDGFGVAVSVTGYPYAAEEPITCSARTASQSPTQERFDCDGYANGTSGSPWVTSDGQVVGVIGGYQEGGDTDRVSYSITFDDRVTQLYHRAAG
ncbi:serine protease [Kitasatospora sp. NBC_00315]|uniref:trypsin-like serine peptidase n=1 Tax=Kitasatospora sp. NBC_00315 TaxID=2975963 RepID=UPI00324D3FDD